MYIESSGGGTFDHAILQSLVYPEIPNQYRALGNDTSGKCKVNISSLDHAILQSLVYPEIPNQYRALGNDTSGKCKVNISSFYHAILQSSAPRNSKPVSYTWQ